jgi:hypothetical protein
VAAGEMKIEFLNSGSSCFHDPVANRRETIGVMVFAILCLPSYAYLIIRPLLLACVDILGRDVTNYYAVFGIVGFLVVAVSILFCIGFVSCLIALRVQRLESTEKILAITYAAGYSIRVSKDVKFLFNAWLVDFADMQQFRGTNCMVLFSRFIPFVVADTMTPKNVGAKPWAKGQV